MEGDGASLLINSILNNSDHNYTLQPRFLFFVFFSRNCDITLYRYIYPKLAKTSTSDNTSTAMFASSPDAPFYYLKAPCDHVT